MSFPFAHALSEQNKDETIIAVVDPANAILVKKLNSNFIIWEYKKDERQDLYLALKKERPKSCYLLTNSLGSYIPYIKAGVPKRIGHGGFWTRFLLNSGVYYSDKSIAQGKRNLSLLGLESSSTPNLITLKSLNHNSKKHLLIFPGAKYGPAKQWNLKDYAKVAELALKDGHRVSLMGTPAEKEDCLKILSMCEDSDAITDLSGTMNLQQMLDWLEQQENLFCLANDSGAFHLLSACGVPSIGMYFSTSDIATPPAYGPFKTVLADIPCRPCFKRTCPLGHYQCREKIIPTNVFKTLLSMNHVH